MKNYTITTSAQRKALLLEMETHAKNIRTRRGHLSAEEKRILLKKARELLQK